MDRRPISSLGIFAVVSLLTFSSVLSASATGGSSPTPSRVGTRASSFGNRFGVTRRSASICLMVEQPPNALISTRKSRLASSPTPASQQLQPRRRRQQQQQQQQSFLLIRGGGVDEDEDEKGDDDEEEIEVEVDIEDDDDAWDEEDEFDDDEDEEEDVAMVTSVKTKSEKSAKEYVDPYFITPTMQIYTTMGTILLSRKIDLFSPRIVRMIRFLFILQVVVQQAFIFFVRILAKRQNDRTPIQLKNPLTGMLESQLEQQVGNGNGMIKNLASSFLKKDSTIMEYDLGQARSMQGGILFNMVLMWFLHFKMEQVQPLLVSTVSGFIQLFYNPLFQVYVLGRNLERPFKSPMILQQESNAANDSIGTEGATESARGVVTDESKIPDVTSEDVQNDDDDDDEDDDDDDYNEEEVDAEEAEIEEEEAAPAAADEARPNDG